MTKDLEDLFGGALPPAPSSALRERVLSIARSVSPETKRDVGIVDRMWESRGVRWGWAVLVSALLPGHVAVSGTSGDGPSAASIAGEPETTSGNDEAAFAALEIPWLRPRPAKPRSWMIDAMVDPSVVSPGGEEP
jgi:hypothetical protein